MPSGSRKRMTFAGAGGGTPRSTLPGLSLTRQDCKKRMRLWVCQATETMVMSRAPCL
jgi:hypothetical protein